jgi:hypothetical protein
MRHMVSHRVAVTTDQVVHLLVAPCTFPTILYRLLKNVYHSSRTVFSLSSKSYQSGRQSSGLRDEVANALEGSLPAKTIII